MAKFNTTVHFGDPDTGETVVAKAGETVSAAHLRAFKKAWGSRADQFIEAEEGDDTLDVAPDVHAKAHIPPDIAPDVETPQIKAVVKENEKVRTEANPVKK